MVLKFMALILAAILAARNRAAQRMMTDRLTEFQREDILMRSARVLTKKTLLASKFYFETESIFFF